MEDFRKELGREIMYVLYEALSGGYDGDIGQMLALINRKPIVSDILALCPELSLEEAIAFISDGKINCYTLKKIEFKKGVYRDDLY